MLVAPDWIVWTERYAGRLRALRRSTGETIVLAKALGEPTQLGQDAAWIYWVETEPAMVRRISKRALERP
jgi:hypothetical protein